MATGYTGASAIESARNPSLEALRGLAASLVLIAHAAEAYLPTARQLGHGDGLYRMALAVDIGRMGVVMFFLISGYVVAGSLRKPGSSVREFAIRRAFRVYPLFWFSVLLAAGLSSPGPVAVAANLTMLPEIFGVPQMLGIYWTLETELASYAIAALLFAAGLLDRPRVLIGLCCGLVALFALMMFGVLPPARLLQWQMLPHNLALILWGALFQLAFDPSARPVGEDAAGRDRLRVVTLMLGVVVVSPSFYSLLQYFQHGDPRSLRLGIAYPVAMLVFLLAYFWKGRVPAVLVWTGTVSYSTYLLHSFVVGWSLGALEQSPALARSLSMPVFAVLMLLLTTLVASVSYWVVERPAIGVGRRLGRRDRVAREPAG